MQRRRAAPRSGGGPDPDRAEGESGAAVCPQFGARGGRPVGGPSICHPLKEKISAASGMEALSTHNEDAGPRTETRMTCTRTIKRSSSLCVNAGWTASSSRVCAQDSLCSEPDHDTPTEPRRKCSSAPFRADD
ncbi:hypothetical protein MHYP_G00113760 [Metynnis hypsauchen]